MEASGSIDAKVPTQRVGHAVQCRMETIPELPARPTTTKAQIEPMAAQPVGEQIQTSIATTKKSVEASSYTPTTVTARGEPTWFAMRRDDGIRAVEAESAASTEEAMARMASNRGKQTGGMLEPSVVGVGERWKKKKRWKAVIKEKVVNSSNMYELIDRQGKAMGKFRANQLFIR